MKPKKQKGFLNVFNVIFGLSIGVLVLYIAIQLFIPFSDLMNTASDNLTNGAVVMALVYLIPLVMVGILIAGAIAEFQRPREYG